MITRGDDLARLQRLARAGDKGARETLIRELKRRNQLDLKLSVDEALRALYAERMIRSFREFVREAWAIIDPDPLIWNWHLDAICMHLQAVAEGRIKRLLVNMPPGHGKSKLFSVLWPAWMWLRRPGWRLLSTAYSSSLSTRDAVASRRLIKSPWYQEMFNPDWGIQDDQDNKTFFATTENGYRVSMSTGATSTGHRGDCVLVDDPIKREDAFSAVRRREANDYILKTLPTRLNNPEHAAMVVVMQRLHSDDPSAHLVKQGWVHLSLAAEYNPKHHCTTSIGFSDPRIDPSMPQILFPDIFTKAALAEQKKMLGSQAYSAQWLQIAVPEGGIIFQHQWWRFWKRDPLTADEVANGTWRQLPKSFKRCFITADTSAGSESSTASYNVYHLWGINGSEVFLLEEFRARLSEVKLISAFEQWCREVLAKWEDWGAKWTCAKYIEFKAAGPELIKQLRQKVPGLIAFNPEGGKKEARARAAAAPMAEAGNIILPGQADDYVMAEGRMVEVKDHYQWVNGVDGYVEEMGGFPARADDDRVDTTSMMASKLSVKSSSREPGKYLF